MRQRNTENGTAVLVFARGTAVINFSDPAEGRRLFDRFDEAGFGGHAKRLRYSASAFGVGVVYCDRGCEAELARLFDSIPEREPDFPGVYGGAGTWGRLG